MNNNDADKRFVFVHRDLQFALPILNVLEIVETPPLLPMVGELRGCLGNVSHRDYLLPVLDPTALGTHHGSGEPSKTFIFVRHENVVFGLAMDRFVAVAALADATDRPSQDGSALSEGNLVETVHAYRDNALVLLSVPAIAALVRANFGSQQFLDGEGRATTARWQAGGETERHIHLCARIERSLFAIPVEHVVEVIEGCDVTLLFKMPPIVRGLINLRGQVLACLDISSDLGLPPRPLEERNQFVVLSGEGVNLALCVDRVTGIRRLDQARVQKTELVLSGDMTRYTDGVIEEKDGTMFVLSAQAIFEAPALQPYRSQEA